MKYINSACMLLYLIIASNFISLSYSLECYVCQKQEKNTEKCLNTIKTCEQEEDRCLSEIRWGSPPYWSRGNAKQYYVSKRCASKNECDMLIKKSMPSCTYIWYWDWKCTECCAGDRCNYYVTLAGNSVRHSLFLLVMGIFTINFLKGWLISSNNL